ncbi:MAG: diacylglycerol kinase family lipid kinase [Clostridia bacterium]|nr:diacylglycerol kinase family lipid kinase [Clostridia bacterium]
MKRRAVVIVNPKAAAGRGLRLWSSVEPLFAEAFEYEVRLSQRPGHATELARQAVQEGARTVVAVGGDGTVHEVVNGMALSDATLGILPFGTGNDFARAMGIPLVPKRAVETLRDGEPRVVDLGRVHGHFYVQVAGTGFDAVVARRVNESGRTGKGALAYLMFIFSTLFSYRNADLRLSAERTVDGRALLLAVANTAMYAGGMKVCPGADPADGQLDWCWVGDLSKAETLAALPRVFNGSHVRLRKVTCGRAAVVEVDGPADLPVQADGECVGTLPARFECVPRALSVIVPRQAQARRA